MIDLLPEGFQAEEECHAHVKIFISILNLQDGLSRGWTKRGSDEKCEPFYWSLHFGNPGILVALYLLLGGGYVLIAYEIYLEICKFA